MGQPELEHESSIEVEEVVVVAMAVTLHPVVTLREVEQLVLADIEPLTEAMQET